MAQFAFNKKRALFTGTVD